MPGDGFSIFPHNPMNDLLKQLRRIEERISTWYMSRTRETWCNGRRPSCRVRRLRDGRCTTWARPSSPRGYRVSRPQLKSWNNAV